ncbi:MAG: EamA family transporter RarD [Clostridia bacterium]|nr:EamA family transporter RarD [Clostridia bacterium]
MNRKNVLLVLACYVMWGLQPLFWDLLAGYDSLFILANRIVWSVVFCVSILALRGDLYKLKAVFMDKATLRYLAPASFFLLLDWGLFIWAVQSGHVLDTSMGYYMGPLVVFGLSLFMFHERCNKWQIVAILFAVAGVTVSALQFGSFPGMAIALSLAFAIYGALKKFAQVEPLVSIAAETLMMAPFALLFLLFFRMGDNGFASVDLRGWLLLAASGAVTAMPMILYSVGVIHLPFYVLGFFQYISPSISLLCGLLMGETLTRERLITFLFIWTGLAIFSLSTLKKSKAKEPAAQGDIANGDDIV